jgi:hypothetical protein
VDRRLLQHHRRHRAQARLAELESVPAVMFPPWILLAAVSGCAVDSCIGAHPFRKSRFQLFRDMR